MLPIGVATLPVLLRRRRRLRRRRPNPNAPARAGVLAYVAGVVSMTSSRVGVAVCVRPAAKPALRILMPGLAPPVPRAHS